MSATPEELSADARAHAAAGRTEEAADGFEAAVAAGPTDPELHMAAGGAAFSAGRFARAVELFEKVIRLTPAHGRALINIGAVHNRTGAYKDAEKVLQRAIGLDHTAAEGFYNLGIARRKLGRKKQAADAYREAVRLDPSFAEAHQNLGNTLLDLGRARAAAEAFRAALRIRPEFAKAAAGLKRAELQASQKDPAFSALGRLVDGMAADGVPKKAGGLDDRFPPLSARRREKDRRQLVDLSRTLEASAGNWSRALKGEMSAALSKLEHVILGSTGTSLVDAGAGFETALKAAGKKAAAHRKAVLKVRAHEELIRAPKLPDPHGGGDGDSSYDAPAAGGGSLSSAESLVVGDRPDAG